MPEEITKPTMIHREMVAEVVQAMIKAQEKPLTFGQWLRDWWFLIAAVVGVISGGIAFYYNMKSHVANQDEHFLPTVAGEKKTDFAKIKFVDDQIVVQQRELGKTLEMQSLKTELQIRKVLQEYRDNYPKFKEKTAKLKEDLNDDGAR